MTRITSEMVRDLTPNALLILVAIDALSGTGPSPKSDFVGWNAGHKDGSWVHRHGKPLESLVDGDCLATLSTNGHCFLTARGRELADLLRSSPPTEPPPTGIDKSPPVGPTVGCRQLYRNGSVAQWCPATVPGFPAPEVNPRSRKSQHQGIWFMASGNTRRLTYGSRIIHDRTCDGTELVAGMSVQASAGSGMRGRLDDREGEVSSVAGGIALVTWPCSGSRAALVGEIMKVSDLLIPGALDYTGLSDHQLMIANAFRTGEATFSVGEDRRLEGKVDGRHVNSRTTEILAGRGLVWDGPFEREPAGMRP